MRGTPPRALTIAGSDSGGGAGIQADLKTFAAWGVYGASAITAVTAQNTRGVRAVTLLGARLVRAQIEAVLEDIGADAIKIGMLGDASVAEAVAETLARWPGIPVVLDPVMVAKGGDRLLAEEAVEVVRRLLVPRAACVTPNVPEAAALTGREVTDLAGMRAAADDLLRAGAGAVLVKGGHLAGDPVDLLRAAGGTLQLRAERVATRHTHGTGCTLSAAITAALAAGDELTVAVRRAHAYLQAAIRAAPGLGGGHGPLGHAVTPPPVDD